MSDRKVTSKPLVGELAELKGAGRDLRIDACRGIALWCIFLDHIPNNVGSWLTLRNYGFSDAAEVFMFVSGVTCALAYGKARRCEGWTAVIRRDCVEAGTFMSHFCCSRSPAPSWFTSQAAAILPTRAIRAFCWNSRA